MKQQGIKASWKVFHRVKKQTGPSADKDIHRWAHKITKGSLSRVLKFPYINDYAYLWKKDTLSVLKEKKNPQTKHPSLRGSNLYEHPVLEEKSIYMDCSTASNTCFFNNSSYAQVTFCVTSRYACTTQTFTLGRRSVSEFGLRTMDTFCSKAEGKAFPLFWIFFLN